MIYLDAKVNFIMGCDNLIVISFAHHVFTVTRSLLSLRILFTFPIILVMPSHLMLSVPLSSLLDPLISLPVHRVPLYLGQDSSLLHPWCSKYLSEMIWQKSSVQSAASSRLFFWSSWERPPAFGIMNWTMWRGDHIPSHLAKALVKPMSKAVWWRLP